MRSTQHDFGTLPDVKVKRSTFDRSHGTKTTFNAGYLIPLFVDEGLPGDTFNFNMTAFIRMATAINPIMDNARFQTFSFFVPNRLIWDHWKNFMGEKRFPNDTTDYLVPQMIPYHPQFLSLSDYFGLPVIDNPRPDQKLTHSAMWHRAYNKIYDDWFRDENLLTPPPLYVHDGPDLITGYHLFKRGKRPDYFTTCLPWAQKGDPVPLPGLGADSVVTATSLRWNSGYTPAYTDDPASTDKFWLTSDSSTTPRWNATPHSAGAMYVDTTSTTGITATSTSTVNPAHSATINQLREAFQIQKMMETDARGGTRYIEMIQAHFGVTSPDSRQQRSEYLGGGTTALHMQQVAQTSSTDSTTPQGNLSGYGTMSAKNHGFTKSITEHGVFLTLGCVVADLTYQQGLHRMWQRKTRVEFYFPALAHLGEQAVKSSELYWDGTDADDLTFGYQERWAEYRYKQSHLTGLMRSAHPQSLDAWHLAQEFGSRPHLTGPFIEENPPFDRVVATPSEPTFIFDGYIKLICSRPMPVNSVPGFVDHF